MHALTSSIAMQTNTTSHAVLRDFNVRPSKLGRLAQMESTRLMIRSFDMTDRGLDDVFEAMDKNEDGGDGDG